LVLEKLTRRGDRIGLADFDPCVVLLNNDLSGGRPAILEDVEQPVLPPMDLGWSDRLKSGHFGQYAEVARDFGALLDLDPWWIAPLHRNCGQVDFMKREGEDCLVANAEMLLGQIQEKYDEYGVRETPFVVVKAEAGTYGMGVMVVRNVDELREMNRNARKKMASAKEGRSVTGAIIQEGVYTFERWTDEQTADATAEPVVYMIDHFVVGGFYRIHPERGNTDNLNAPGAQFRPLAFAEPCTTPRCDQDPDARPNRFYAYGVVARLALLAAAREQAVALAADARVAA
jgi:glutamate--cysteine ligase, T. ferrooxidans family